MRPCIQDQLEHEGDLVVVREAVSRETNLELVERLTPGLVVLNIRLRNKSDIEITKKLVTAYSAIKILILNDYEQTVSALARVDVASYMPKETSQEE